MNLTLLSKLEQHSYKIHKNDINIVSYINTADWGGEHAPWSVAHTKEDCVKWLTIIKEKDYISRNTSLLPANTYGDIFTNPNSEYPHWIGYSIGYQVVESFRINHPNMAWSDIMKLTSEEIAKSLVDDMSKE